MPASPLRTKTGKRRAARARAQRVCPEGQEQHGPADAPEIGFHAAKPRGSAMAANGGDGEQQGGEQRGKHVGCERRFSGPTNPVGRLRRADEPLEFLVRLVRGHAVGVFGFHAAFLEDFGDVRCDQRLFLSFRETGLMR